MTEEILIRVFRIITISQEQLKKVEQADKLKPTCSTLVEWRLACMEEARRRSSLPLQVLRLPHIELGRSNL